MGARERLRAELLGHVSGYVADGLRDERRDIENSIAREAVELIERRIVDATRPPIQGVAAKAADGECGERYFHTGPRHMLECCRERGHIGVHEGFTGTADHPRDCEWRWWSQ